MIGLDTGYFLRLLKGHVEAGRIWTAIMDGEEAAVSCLTLFELARFARKGAIEADAEKTLREAIVALCRVCWLDREDALLSAANLSHGIGLHAMDALILSGFLAANVTTIIPLLATLKHIRRKECGSSEYDRWEVIRDILCSPCQALSNPVDHS